MKTKLLLIAVIAVLALSACAVPPAQPLNAQPAPVQQQAAEQPRTINVNGTGQVSLAPDVAYVYIGVQSQGETVADVLADNNGKAQSVTQALKELGVDEKDIQTSSFNIYPQQNYPQQPAPDGSAGTPVTTYQVNNTVFVTVRDLSKLGQLLDVVVRSGANSINGITFDVLDKTAATTQARQLAIESARTQAEEIAKAAGVTLVDLQTMSAYSTSNPLPMFEGKGAAYDAASVPVSAGQLVIRVDVSAAYTIR